MSVAKKILVSGSREKSLEIMGLRLPPLATRTSVRGHLSLSSAHLTAEGLRRLLRPNSRCDLRLSPDSVAPSTYVLASYFILKATQFIDTTEHSDDPTADHHLD